MPKNTLINNKQSGLFIYLLILTGCFIGLELSLIFQYSDVYINDFQFFANRLRIPLAIVPGVLFFIFAQLFLHFIFTVLVWGAARLTGIALNCSWRMTEKIGFSLWIFGIVTVLLANQYFVPNSKFSILTRSLINEKILSVFIFAIALSLAMLLTICVYGFLLLLSRKVKVFLGLIFVSVCLGKFFLVSPVIITDAATAEKPNVIIIGFDSLRPDYLGYFGYEKITPHLDNFLNQASVFSEALTPLARTFPAWVSILTGQYPINTGARTDLINPHQLKLANSLPALLNQHGYHTIFSTDETRFSNITRGFGFDTVITPPMGFNDFLLGTVNDFPFANLIINTSLGKFFFPHSYGNRPVAITYDPNSYLNLLKSELGNPRKQPVFLAIHLCLTHTPFYWNSQFSEKPYRNYQAALHKIDQQFQDLMTMLAENKLLEHSIVVLLSDHGEAFELPGDRITEADLFIPGKNKKIPHFYPLGLDNEEVNQSVGHGTDVLGLSQYRTLLAFRLYGLGKQQNSVISGRVSLLDIKPTILDLIQQNIPHRDDGGSLKDFILGKKSIVPFHSDFFTESDFSPQSVHAVFPETRKVLLEGVEYFQIDQATTQLIVKENMENMIYSSKQVADIYGSWMLALYPQNNNRMIPILVNLNSGQWTNDLETPFAQSSPAKQMLKALKNFFPKQVSSQELT